MRNALMVVALVCSLGAALPVQADAASHRKAVLELFSAMKMESIAAQAIDAILAAQLQANPEMAPLEPKLRQFFTKYMSWKAMQEDYVVLYMQAFSESEITQLAAFYKTSVGRKSIEKMPALMQKGAEIGADRVRKHMPELLQLLGATPSAN